MASPKSNQNAATSDANGFTRIPRALLRSIHLMGDAELRVVLTVADYTLGWEKERDTISGGQFEAATGLSRGGVRRGIAEAYRDGFISRQPAPGAVFSDFVYWLATDEDRVLLTITGLPRDIANVLRAAKQEAIYAAADEPPMAPDQRRFSNRPDDPAAFPETTPEERALWTTRNIPAHWNVPQSATTPPEEQPEEAQFKAESEETGLETGEICSPTDTSIVTEIPYGTEKSSLPTGFEDRNRVIAALSYGGSEARGMNEEDETDPDEWLRQQEARRSAFKAQKRNGIVKG